MSVPAYAAYKDSGVEWLGKVPTHWGVMRLRFVTLVNPPKSEVAHLPDATEVSFLPMEAIGDRGELDLSRTRAIGEVRTGYSYLTEGDVIFAKVTPCLENGKGALAAGLEGGRAFATTEVTVLRPAQPDDGHFLWWLTSSKVFRGPAEGSMYGAGGLKRVSDDWVADYRAPWPPEGERLAIAAFLDQEVGKIDALVEEQRRLIALLKEKRQAVISHAVTKGLNPAVPMKDSGIEWLGEVPAHWETAALKRLVRLQSGEGITSEGIEPEGTYPVFGGNGQRGFTEDFTHEGEFVLIGRQGALCGNINYASGRFWASEHALVAHPVDRFEEKWLGEVLRAINLGQYSVAAAQPGLSADLLGKLKVPVPPSAEQSAIVAWLDRETGKTDALAGEAERTVLLLQERRAALISAAVTGKIDVRDLVAVQDAMEAA